VRKASFKFQAVFGTELVTVAHGKAAAVAKEGLIADVLCEQSNRAFNIGQLRAAYAVGMIVCASALVIKASSLARLGAVSHG
jgi:hypothetical protein